MTNKERLRGEIQSCIEGKLYHRESIMICEHTPQILLDVGLDDKPILLSQKHLRNGLHPKGKNPHWHGLKIDDYLNLEENIQSPSFIVDSFSDDESVLVITSTVDSENNPIIAAIRTTGAGQYQLRALDSNYLTSVYGRENFMNFITKNVEADFVLYANKEKIQELERISKLPLFGDYSKNLEFNTIIHKSNNIVNEDGQIISDFREKTDKYFDKNAFGGLTPEEIEDDVRAYISSTLFASGLDKNVEIEDVIITGSRSRGLEGDSSDLDIVFSYKSPVVEGSRGYKEDELFNLLNEYDENDEEDRDLHELHGIKIDINPIRPEETGFLADYLITAEEYLESKRKELEMSDNISHSFINDREKINDFFILSKEEFLSSYSYLSDKDYEDTLEDVNKGREFFGKGSWGIEFYEVEAHYRVYELDLPAHTIAYVDTIEEAQEEASNRGVLLHEGSVMYAFDDDSNRIAYFVPSNEETREYSIQEIYRLAEGRTFGDPWLEAKDNAFAEIADFMEEMGEKNPYSEEYSGDSSEDIMLDYLEYNDYRISFDRKGHINTVYQGDELISYVSEADHSFTINFYDENTSLYKLNRALTENVIKPIEIKKGSGLMTVEELSKSQLTELKQRYYTEKLGDEGVSYGELANIDNLVTDKEVFDYYEGFSFSEDDFAKEEDSAMSDEKKKVNVEAGEENGQKKVYISLHKSYCHQQDSKLNEGEKFNIMRMPKGTELDGKDIGGARINPLYMAENKYNPNEMTATYYVPENGTLEIKLSHDDGSFDKVNVEDLKKSIDAQKEAYKEKQKEQEQQKEKSKDKKKEKDSGAEID